MRHYKQNSYYLVYVFRKGKHSSCRSRWRSCWKRSTATVLSAYKWSVLSWGKMFAVVAEKRTWWLSRSSGFHPTVRRKREAIVVVWYSSHKKGSPKFETTRAMYLTSWEPVSKCDKYLLYSQQVKQLFGEPFFRELIHLFWPAHAAFSVCCYKRNCLDCLWSPKMTLMLYVYRLR